MAAKKDRVLWADDEIDLLKPHILFLQDKGYEVIPVISGQDAIECCKEESFDIIFLDENMPGLTGLETLAQIKAINPDVPVVMVTKSEEESIMNQAIGNKIADYLIKPVNPNQLLLSIKKNVHKNVIISETTTVGYQQEFGRIGMQINDSLTTDDWMEVYKKLVYWEIELENSQVPETSFRSARASARRRSSCGHIVWRSEGCCSTGFRRTYSIRQADLLLRATGRDGNYRSG